MAARVSPMLVAAYGPASGSAERAPDSTIVSTRKKVPVNSLSSAWTFLTSAILGEEARYGVSKRRKCDCFFELEFVGDCD